MFFKVTNKKYYTIKKGFQKALWPFCRTLNSWIGEFMISFFDVTNRLFITEKMRKKKCFGPIKSLFSFSTAQIEKNPWKKLGKTKLGVFLV